MGARDLVGTAGRLALGGSQALGRASAETTLEDQPLYRDALRMLGCSKLSIFEKLGRSLEVPV